MSHRFKRNEPSLAAKPPPCQEAAYDEEAALEPPRRPASPARPPQRRSLKIHWKFKRF